MGFGVVCWEYAVKRGNIVTVSVVLFAFSAFPSVACAQVAETAEDASRLLAGLINMKMIEFRVGNIIHPKTREAYYQIGGTRTDYRRGLLGGLKETHRYRLKPSSVLYLQYDVGFAEVARSSRGGEGDSCLLSIQGFQGRYAAQNSASPWKYAQKVNDMNTSADHSVLELDEDPSKVLFPKRSIDFGEASFSREQTTYKTSVFSFSAVGNEAAPYTTLTVKDSAVADHVENAIRVLQLSCG